MKKFSARSISRQTVRPAVFIVPILLAALATGCGESPGGVEYGGDTTAPVTKVDTASGAVAKFQVITFECTDNSSGCATSWLSAEKSGDPIQFFKMYDAEVSGSTTSFTAEISGTHTTGNYDYKFYSKDKSSNTESVNTRVYTVP